MDFIVGLLPSTPLDWILQIVLGFIAGLIIMSFIEYVLHAYFMHRQILPDFVYRYAKSLKDFFYEHAVLHHHTYYKKFNFEPDSYGRDLNLIIDGRTVFAGILVALPVMVLVTIWISIIPPLMLILVAVLHKVVWSLIHPEMHHPRYPFWTKWSIYKFLARYHYMHHVTNRERRNLNFNVVLPFADYVMGKVATPTEEDLKEMQKLGFTRN